MGYSAFRPTGLTFHNPAASVKGYTLVTPMNGHSTYLLDMSGQVVHEWRYPAFRAFYARLLPSGTLAMLAVDNSITPPQVPEGRVPTWTETVRRIGGNATHLVELDWDSNVVWQYENHDMHHDFVRLANGNTLVSAFIELPPEVERSVRGGFRERFMPPMISDDFVESRPRWQGSAPRQPLEAAGPAPRSHLPAGPSTRVDPHEQPRRDAGRLHPVLDPPHQPGRPHRHRWQPDLEVRIPRNQPSAPRLRAAERQRPDLRQRHAPSRQPALRYRRGRPEDQQDRLEYTANPEIQFLSAHISGAERLTGGNVLICEGAPGRVFEITSKGEVVWEWVNPFEFRMPNGTINPNLFRAHRYSADHAALRDRELDPREHAKTNRMYGLSD